MSLFTIILVRRPLYPWFQPNWFSYHFVSCASTGLEVLIGVKFVINHLQPVKLYQTFLSLLCLKLEIILLLKFWYFFLYYHSSLEAAVKGFAQVNG